MRIPVLLASLAIATPVGAQTAAPAPLPDGVVEVRFGEEVPVLGCGVLRACRVELQAGERLLSPPALGDAERWLTAQVASGPGGAVPVVVVKPTACGITTNLMIATDRRIYDLDLEAAPCRGATRIRGRAVRFAYPEAPASAYVSAVDPVGGTLAERAARAPNTAYRMRRRGDFPWVPTRVADDGAHVYLELPPEARSSAAPVLYSLDSGERTLINYATEGEVFVTDRLFRRAALVIGEASLEIERGQARRSRALGRVGLAALSAGAGVVATLWLGR